MKNVLLVALLIIGSQFNFAQNSKLIIGKWAFVSIQDDGQADEQSKQLMSMMFKDLTLSFRGDNTMSLQLKKKPDNGTYSFDKSNEEIINAISGGGKVMTLTIIKLTKEELTINMDKGGIFNLKKVSDTPDPFMKTEAVPLVAVTAKQITAKWDIVDMEKEKKSEMFYELLKGAFIIFNQDATYQAKILDIEEEGEWMLTKGNTAIEIETPDGISYWNILKATDTEMTMQRGTDGPKFMFKKAIE